MIAGEDYGRETLKKLGPHLFTSTSRTTASIPRERGWSGPGTGARSGWITSGCGNRGGSISTRSSKALADVQYRGYVTIHQAFAGIMSWPKPPAVAPASLSLGWSERGES